MLDTWPSHPGGHEPNVRLALPSVDPDFPFQVDLAVRYDVDRRTAIPPQPLLIATGDIARRARDVAGQWPLTAAAQLRAELEIALSHRLGGEYPGVVSWAHCTSVTADDELVNAVRRRQEAQRNAQIRSWQWEEQARQIAMLHDIITDPRHATAWWLLKNEDKVDQLVEMARRFRELREVLNATVPDQRPSPSDQLAVLVTAFWERSDGVAREHLIRDVSRLFVTYRSPDLVAGAQSLLDGES